MAETKRTLQVDAREPTPASSYIAMIMGIKLQACRFESCQGRFDKRKRCQKHHPIESAIVVILDTCQLKASVRGVEIRNSEYQKTLVSRVVELVRAVKTDNVFPVKEQDRDRNESLQ